MHADASRDDAGNPGGSRDRQPPADAAGRPGPAARVRPLHLAAAGDACAPKGRDGRPRRDERGRGPGSPDAGGPAGRAVGRVRTLGQLRPRAAASERPPRTRLLRRADPRGGHHRHRAARGAQLQAAPHQPVPDPDEVPRRDPPALRRDAGTRVHHEGCLFLRRRRRGSRTVVPRDARRLLPDIRAPRARLSRGGRRLRRDWRQPFAGVSRPRGLWRGRHRVLRRRIRVECRAGPVPGPGRDASRAGIGARIRRHPRGPLDRGPRGVSRGTGRTLRQDPARGRRGRRSRRPRAARRPRAERDQGGTGRRRGVPVDLRSTRARARGDGMRPGLAGAGGH